MNIKDLGQRITRLRNLKGLTYEALAKASGVTENTLLAIEKGRVHVIGAGNLAPAGMTAAEKLMSEKCPGGYNKIEVGEEASGVRMGVGDGATSVDMPARYVEFKCIGQGVNMQDKAKAEAEEKARKRKLAAENEQRR